LTTLLTDLQPGLYIQAPNRSFAGLVPLSLRDTYTIQFDVRRNKEQKN